MYFEIARTFKDGKAFAEDAAEAAAVK